MGKRLPSDCGDHGGVVSWGSAAIIAGTNFTSGALFSDAKRDAAAAAEAARLQALKSNEELPLVYLDVAIKGRPIGRIHFVLFTKEAPRAGVQNCTDSGRQSIKIRSACCHHGFPAQIIIAAAVRYGATAHTSYGLHRCASTLCTLPARRRVQALPLFLKKFTCHGNKPLAMQH